MKNHYVKEFWGGDARGLCLQIMSIRAEDGEGFIQLTMEEAAELYVKLSEFTKKEAARRQGLLQKKLETLKIENTILNDAVKISLEHVPVSDTAIEIISILCPKS